MAFVGVDGAGGAVGGPTLPLVGVAPVVESLKVVTIGDADGGMGGGEGDGAIGAFEGVAVVTQGPEMEGMGRCRGESADDGGRGGGKNACACARSELVAKFVFNPEWVRCVPMNPDGGVLLVGEGDVGHGTVHY